MRRKDPQDRLEKKRHELVRRTALALGTDEAAAGQLLLAGRRQSVRLNPLVADPQLTLATMRSLGWQGEAYDWSPDCYSLEGGADVLRDSSLAADGRLYIQNAASWLPVLALEPRPGDRILDVCAAPGGKTTHIAALTANRAQITANDNSRPRLMKLRATCDRLGAAVEAYTLFDAVSLARRFDSRRFDRILIDAPCSGEGLMRLDRDKDFASWSVAHVRRLQTLQKRILTQAWQLLEPGGTLVYSTCTMAPEENEAVIDYGLRVLPGAALRPLDWQLTNRLPALAAWNGRQFNPLLGGCLRLAPSLDVEAFFVARLTKHDAVEDHIRP